MIIGKRFYFDAAHHLPKHKGRCRQSHGHTYTIDVEVEGRINKEGMVIDLFDLSTVVNNVLGIFDHHDLNDIVETPTCEVIAGILFDRISREVASCGVAIHSITVREGRGGWARI